MKYRITKLADTDWIIDINHGTVSEPVWKWWRGERTYEACVQAIERAVNHPQIYFDDKGKRIGE